MADERRGDFVKGGVLDRMSLCGAVEPPRVHFNASHVVIDNHLHFVPSIHSKIGPGLQIW